MTRSPGQVPTKVDESHTHHSDSLIDPETNEPAAVGEQTIRLLGPFPVAFNTPNIGTGVTFTVVETGSLILDAWFYGSDGEGTGSISVSATGNVEDVGTIAMCSGTVLALNGDATQIQNAVSSMHFETGGPLICPEDMKIVVQLFGGDWTAGEARVFALIAEPAE